MFEDVAESVLEYAKEANYADVRVESFNNTSIIVVNGSVQRGQTYLKKGAGIRVLVNGAWGFQSTTDLNKNSLKRATERAMAMARAESSRTKEKVELAPIKICQDTVAPKAKIDFREMPLEDKISLNLEWNKAMMVDPDPPKQS